MTRLPHESRLVIDRPDLPEYELNKACPVTGEVAGLENHHISPRSFGTKSYWVELPTGEIVGNRINLSSQAHYRVTVNKARIVYEDGVFYWDEAGEKVPLRWQPPTWGEYGEEIANVFAEGLAGMFIIPKQDEQHLHEGEPCPTCKRRIPKKKKESSPKTSVFSTRVPIDDKETFEDLVDAAAEHHGLTSRSHHRYWILLYGVTLLLQAKPGELPS